MTLLRLFLAASLVTAALARPADAGGDRSARRLRRSALAHYNQGAYAEAARDFRASYEIEPHPELLYALGQSLRLAGECAAAIDAYEDFLITGPEETQASAAREKIQACRQILWPEPEPEPEPEPARISQPVVTAAPPHRAARSWIREPVGGALLAGGVASAATGAWLMLGAEVGADGEPPADRLTAGGILLGAGTGLLAAAIVRYATVGRDSGGAERPTVAASVHPGGGAGLWVSGRF